MFNTPKKQAAEGSSSETTQTPNAIMGFSDIEKYFSDFENNYLNRGWLSPFQWPSHRRLSMPFEGRTPNVDVVDRESDILVKAELPGIDKGDIDINLTDHTLTIKAEHTREKKEEKSNYFRREISCGSFSRPIALPSAVNIDKAKAQFKDGVLELTLPKIEAPARKKITVE